MKTEPKPKPKLPVQLEQGGSGKPVGGTNYWKAMTVKFDQASFIKLKHQCANKNMTAQAIVMQAMQDWFEKNP